MSLKDFVKSGIYMLDEVKRLASKGDSHWFDADSMRFFSSRVSDLCWKKDDLIYFISSEADSNPTKHSGSVRGWTVRTCSTEGRINKIGEFQEHASLRDAQKALLEIIA